jgi:glycerophosphoryl diester phosphodiesterase
MIRVLAHRGLWDTPDEHNTEQALVGSLRQGFGLETDVRDDGTGRLVISHDPPRGGELSFTTLTGTAAGTGLPLAVNVKADGLSGLLADAFAGTGIDWFAFDMSVPEMLRYDRAGLPYFTRHSDVEPEPIGYERAAGVWLDAFHGDWFDADVIHRHLDAGKRVAVVSPELHGRPVDEVWAWLSAVACPEAQDLMICSDHPGRLSRMLQEQS